MGSARYASMRFDESFCISVVAIGGDWAGGRGSSQIEAGN